MKLLLVIVRDNDAENVVAELIKNNYRVTRMASTGGFMRRGNVTLMIGVDSDKVDTVVELVQNACAAPEPGQHRATVFVVDMPFFKQI